MKSSLCLLFVLGLCGPVVAAFAKIERVVEKSFTVQSGGTLRIETSGGSIQVEPAGGHTVEVIARQQIRASSEAEADELLKDLTLTIEQSGNDVSASAKYAKRPSGSLWRSWPPVAVDFVVKVPATFAADLKTSGGKITVGDLQGTVQARTSGGGITLGRIAAEVDASTSGGNISLGEGHGAVSLRTSGGSITAGRVSGPATLSTSGCNIRLDAAEHSVQARTSGGSVRVGFVGPLEDDCTLSTSGGSVRATVDKAAAFELDASTSGGSVDASGLPITIGKGGVGKSRLAGAVNGGGPLLKLKSSGGSIGIELR